MIACGKSEFNKGTLSVNQNAKRRHAETCRLFIGGGDAALEINTKKGKLIRSGKSRQKLCAPVQAMTGSDEVLKPKGESTPGNESLAYGLPKGIGADSVGGLVEGGAFWRKIFGEK